MKLDVTVRPITPKNGLIAYATVKFNDCFAVDGMKILTGSKGLYVDMPSTPDGRGNYHNVCYPVTADFRARLSQAVLAGYGAAIEKMWDMLDVAENLRKSGTVPPFVPPNGEQPGDAGE
jgi:stage V sporulation protein G